MSAARLSKLERSFLNLTTALIATTGADADEREAIVEVLGLIINTIETA